MPYRLTLPLNFGVTLVSKTAYAEAEEASQAAGKLPNGFRVVPEEQVDFNAALFFPVKENNKNEN
jgi:hypothetical protein